MKYDVVWHDQSISDEVALGYVRRLESSGDESLAFGITKLMNAPFPVSGGLVKGQGVALYRPFRCSTVLALGATTQSASVQVLSQWHMFDKFEKVADGITGANLRPEIAAIMEHTWNAAQHEKAVDEARQVCAVQKSVWGLLGRAFFHSGYTFISPLLAVWCLVAFIFKAPLAFLRWLAEKPRTERTDADFEAHAAMAYSGVVQRKEINK